MPTFYDQPEFFALSFITRTILKYVESGQNQEAFELVANDSELLCSFATTIWVRLLSRRLFYYFISKVGKFCVLPWGIFVKFTPIWEFQNSSCILTEVSCWYQKVYLLTSSGLSWKFSHFNFFAVSLFCSFAFQVFELNPVKLNWKCWNSQNLKVVHYESDNSCCC